MWIHVRGCACAWCACTCVYKCIWSPEVLCWVWSSISITFWVSRWTGRQQAIQLLLSTSPVRGSSTHTTMPSIYVGTGDPKSGPHACTANSLLNTSSLEPWHKDIFKHLFHGKYKFGTMRQKRGASDFTWRCLPSESQWWIPVCLPLSPQTSEEVLRVGL